MCTRARWRESTAERLDGGGGGGGGDACEVHDACGVMYAPCAAGCVRRVAYTSYMPGGSESRVPRSVPRSHTCTYVRVRATATQMCPRPCPKPVASYYVRCYYTPPRYELSFPFRNTLGSLPRERALITPRDARTRVSRRCKVTGGH